MDRIVVNGIEYARTQPSASTVPAVERIPQPRMVERTCKWCKKAFQARTADVNRGWALFCSKSCKAMKQEKSTGQYRAIRTAPTPKSDRSDWRTDWDSFGDDDQSWDAHKNCGF